MYKVYVHCTMCTYLQCRGLDMVAASINEVDIVFVEAKWTTHDAMKAKHIAEEFQQRWKFPKTIN